MMTFQSVLSALELAPAPSSQAQWEHWFSEAGLQHDPAFMQAMSLGADQLLSRYSNAEQFASPSGQLHLIHDGQTLLLPLLHENQGNFTYGLRVSGPESGQVVVTDNSADKGDLSSSQNWLSFTENFNEFAFCRLHDFQYLFNQVSGEVDFFGSGVLRPDGLTSLARAFDCGPVTPDVYDWNPGVRRYRFYRAGQRISLSVRDEDSAYWEMSARTESLFLELHNEFRRLALPQ